MMIKRSTRFILFFLLALWKTAVAQTHDVFGAIAFPLSEYPQLENIVRSEADLPLLRAALYDGPNVTWETLSAYEFIRGETFDENTGELITAERFYQRLDFVTLSHTETESLDRIELYLEYPDTTLQLLDTVDNPGQRRQISALSSALSTHSRTTLINNGASANRVDILLLGDGYKKNELEKWKTDAEYIMNKFFEEEPFRSYRRYFNVHRIDVASNESGASRAGGIQRDTAFGSYFVTAQ